MQISIEKTSGGNLIAAPFYISKSIPAKCGKCMIEDFEPVRKIQRNFNIII